MFGIPVTAIVYGGLIVGALSVGGIWLHKHDVSIRLADAAAINAASTAALNQAHNAAMAALEDRATTAEALANSVQSMKGKIHNAPQTSACVNSPAIRSTLDGLHKPDGGNGH